MDAALLLITARRQAGLSLRGLAELADTSHATLSAYEHGHKVPTVATLGRILTAAGFGVDVVLAPRVPGTDRRARGDELVEALRLAAQFPARHDPALTFPRFGRVA
jgi:transcriptional regulator with XRE-family HTH domain